MIANKAVYDTEYNNQFYIFIFLLSEFIDTFVAIVIVIFVDTISITDIILSQVITEVSAILFKYLSFLQVFVLGFEL